MNITEMREKLEAKHAGERAALNELEVTWQKFEELIQVAVRGEHRTFNIQHSTSKGEKLKGRKATKRTKRTEADSTGSGQGTVKVGGKTFNRVREAACKMFLPDAPDWFTLEELARALGMKPDSVGYHVRKLMKLGELEAGGSMSTRKYRWKGKAVKTEQGPTPNIEHRTSNAEPKMAEAPKRRGRGFKELNFGQREPATTEGTQGTEATEGKKVQTVSGQLAPPPTEPAAPVKKTVKQLVEEYVQGATGRFMRDQVAAHVAQQRKDFNNDMQMQIGILLNDLADRDKLTRTGVGRGAIYAKP